MGAAGRWQALDARLRRLDFLDSQEEAVLVSEAYNNLIFAYQEARSLNDELAKLACELTRELEAAGRYV